MPDYVAGEEIVIVGAGGIAIDYARVLQDQKIPFSAIGRGESSCERFVAATGVKAQQGGLCAILSVGLRLPCTAIVTVGVEDLSSTCVLLLQNGVRRILLEKPGGNGAREIRAVAEAARSAGAEVFLAYNRRFYTSSRRAREIIAEDGGLTSFTFEFTEWSHDIEKLDISSAVKRNWFLANSSHVCDLAFFLGGTPARFSAESAGALPWHPAGAVFAGAGVTEKGALFSYHANWDSAGRWGLELSTRARRLILRPMEKLAETRRGTVSVQDVPLTDDLDQRFKPGLYRQVQAFLTNDNSDLLPVDAQLKMVNAVYARMCPNPDYSIAG